MNHVKLRICIEVDSQARRTAALLSSFARLCRPPENYTMARSYEKAGYLHDDFRIFYLQNPEQKAIPFHYHDFHKLLIFLRGNVGYIIESQQYDLQNGDIILVPAGEIHRPVIYDENSYERMIFYISPAFLEQHRQKGSDLERCFCIAKDRGTHLVRPKLSRTEHSAVDSSTAGLFIRSVRELAASFSSPRYCNSLYQKSKFLELLILLNEMLMEDEEHYAAPVTSNPTVQAILDYINDHLTEEELSIDQIAGAVFLNRSYLMHLFRDETGFTIGSYISEKRLFHARSLIRNGSSVTDACFASGFKNYSAFYYAYRKKYKTEQEYLL